MQLRLSSRLTRLYFLTDVMSEGEETEPKAAEGKICHLLVQGSTGVKIQTGRVDFGRYYLMFLFVSH